MKKRFITLLIASHMLVGAIGFVIGIYLLPIFDCAGIAKCYTGQ